MSDNNERQALVGSRAILVQKARAHAAEQSRYDDTEDLVGTLVGMASVIEQDAHLAPIEVTDGMVEAAVEAFKNPHRMLTNTSDGNQFDRMCAALEAAFKEMNR